MPLKGDSAKMQNQVHLTLASYGFLFTWRFHRWAVIKQLTVPVLSICKKLSAWTCQINYIWSIESSCKWEPLWAQNRKQLVFIQEWSAVVTQTGDNGGVMIACHKVIAGSMCSLLKWWLVAAFRSSILLTHLQNDVKKFINILGIVIQQLVQWVIRVRIVPNYNYNAIVCS